MSPGASVRPFSAITPAIGEITHLSGRLLTASGSPIRNATVEIWEVDHSGIYLADQSSRAKYDANFQGFGRFFDIQNVVHNLKCEADMLAVF